MNAPVWTRLHRIEEDFSGMGDIRLPISLRLDALLAAMAVFGVCATVAAKTQFSQLAHGGPLAVIVFLAWLVGPTVAVYRFLCSTHPDGRGRLRRLAQHTECAVRRSVWPPDRCGRQATRRHWRTEGHVRRTSRGSR